MENTKTKKVSLNISVEYFELLIMIADYLKYENNNSERSKHSDSRANTLALNILNGEILSTNNLASVSAKIRQHVLSCQTQAKRNIDSTLEKLESENTILLKKEVSSLLKRINGTETTGIKVSLQNIIEKNKSSMNNILAILSKSTKYLPINNEITGYFKTALSSIDIDQNTPKNPNLIFRVSEEFYNKYLMKEKSDGTNPSMRRALKFHLSNNFCIYGEHIPTDLQEEIWAVLNDYNTLNENRNKAQKIGTYTGIEQYFIELHKISKRIKELETKVGGQYGNTNSR